MERTDVLELMSTLKLYGMRAAYDDVMATGIKRRHEPPRIVGDLLSAEIAEKQARSIKYQRTIAKLPLAKDIDEFDFTGTPINEALVRDLATGRFIAEQRNAVLIGGTGTGKSHLAIAIARACIRSGARGGFYTVVDLVNRLESEALAGLDFINRAEVIHLLGPPGTGKSHLATALAVEAVRAGKSVYFIPLADLVAVLAKAEREGTLREKIRFLCRCSLLVVDEIGYLPVTPGGGNLFFQVVNARYEKGAMILTSNRGFAEWGDAFGDPVVATALLDRLLHHAVVVQIEGVITFHRIA